MAPYIPPHLRPEFLKRIKSLPPGTCEKSAVVNNPAELNGEDVTSKDNNHAVRDGLDDVANKDNNHAVLNGLEDGTNKNNNPPATKHVRVASEPIEIPAAVYPPSTSDVDCSKKTNTATPEKSQVSLESNINVESTPALTCEDSGSRSTAGLTNVETHATTLAASSTQANPLRVNPMLPTPMRPTPMRPTPMRPTPMLLTPMLPTHSSGLEMLLADDEDVKMPTKPKHPVERLSTTVIKPPVMPDLDHGWNVSVPEEQGKKKNNKKKSATWDPSVEDDSDKQSRGNNITKKNGWAKIQRVKKTESSAATDEGGDSDNGGWGVQHNGYDPNSAAALMDWAGNWLPAPPHWESRRSFTNRNFFADTATWIDHTEKAQGTIVSSNGSTITIQKLTVDIENEAFTSPSSPEDTVLADVAPKAWLPDQIEGQSVQTFWSSFIQSAAPLTIEENERPPTKPDWQPYWTRYIGDDLPFVKTLDVPDYRLDPNDELYDVAQTDKGSNLKCTAKIEQIQRTKKYKQRARNAESRRHQNQNHRVHQSQNPHRPKVNIYLRIARPSDFPQITDIYNWYVANTVYTPERAQRSMVMIAARHSASAEEKLNWVVAVRKSNSGNKASGARDAVAVQSQHETIVGFGCADDYVGMDSAYGYTATLELYVHPDYLHMGVGKNLMDRLMFLLDPGHKTYAAVEWRVREPEHMVAGGVRIIENVIINVPYVPGEEDQRMKWMEGWLRGFGFKKVGTLDKIGVKSLKWVSVSIFQKRTDSGIDPKHMI